MVHPPSKIVDELFNIALYTKKGIEVWDHVCEIQNPWTTKALQSNLYIIFFLSQGSTQEKQGTLGEFATLYIFASWGDKDSPWTW